MFTQQPYEPSAGYVVGGILAVFAAKGSPFTGSDELLPALTGEFGYYVLRQCNLQPRLSAGEIQLGDEHGGLADFTVGSFTSYDLLGLVCRGPVEIECASATVSPPAPFPAAWLLTLRYDLIQSLPAIASV